MFGVPHASICGGRARCSTCRVKIESADGELPPPGAAEAATLARIHADPDVRLACQLRPQRDMTVTRLVRPPEQSRALFPAAAEEVGVERTLAILFLDIRGFTALSEARLPYDTVFLLNRFFAEVGEAVTAAGGWIDKYLGDGLMALFGLNEPTEDACRAALLAAMRIDAALERLNGELGARARRAAEDRHRPACRPAGARPHRPSRLRRDDGDRPGGQRREPAGEPHQGARRADRRLVGPGRGGRAAARTPSRRRSSPSAARRSRCPSC